MPESEERELIDELVRSWVEVYKKSATTLVLLQIIRERQSDTAQIASAFRNRTSWDLTERGLYRTLRRLADLGLLAVDHRPGRRTGAAIHLYTLSARGGDYLERLEGSLI